jgi:parvulin-like peptidyl-prolyl isomerase
LIASLSGCGGDAPPASTAPGVDLDAALRAPMRFDDPVATVKGQPLGAGVLRQILGRADNRRGRDEVLQDMILGELYYEEALASGYGALPEMQDLHRRLMVERLLELEIDAPNTAADIPAAEARAYYDNNYFLYRQPELRDSTHLLVMPSSKRWDIRKDEGKIPPEVFVRAEGLAQQIHQDIQARGESPLVADDLKAIKARWDALTPEDLEILVEDLPPAPQQQFGEPGKPNFIPAMVNEYSSALYALAPGQRSAPTRSPFGVHIMVLEKILPAEEISWEEAEPNIRAFLAAQRRQEAFARFTQKLNREGVLLVNDVLIEETFREETAQRPTQ